MAKKSKDKKKQQPYNETSNSSDIFNTLFGATPADSNIASLFSDENPFKRKPNDNPTATEEPKLGVVEVSIENQTDGVSGNNDSGSAELKKRKKKDKKVNLDSGSVAEEVNEEEGGKSKRVALSGVEESNGVVSDSGRKKKAKNVILGLESVGEGVKESNDGISNSGNLEKSGLESKKDKKKKRKRDEIEAEYEAKRYGVVAVEDVEKGIGEMVVGEKRKKMDNPEDMMVSNEGFDDESKLLRTIFVGNLPLKIKKKALLKEFGSFGEIESVRIRSIPVADSATPRKAAIIKQKLNDNADSVNAYVVFKSEESAQASLAHNMAVVGERHIRVDRACPPRKKMKGENSALYDNKRTLFVGNLPFDVKDEEIYQLFSGMKEFGSSIEAVRVIRDPNTLLGKGIAYVLFKTREAANTISRKRNLKLRDRELRVSHSKADSTPSKRKSLSTEDRFRSPAKKFAADSARPGSSSYKATAKSDMSYQGVKASKSGVQKKTQSRMSDRGKLKPKAQLSTKPKERMGKRPSVAARKAKELKAAASGLKQTKRTGDLYIADAYLGLMKVGPEGGLAESLTTEAEGVPIGFANDLDVDDDGNVYFTDSSTKYQRRNFIQLVFSGEDSGKVLKYNPRTKETTILIRNLQFPNGLSLSKDGFFFIFCEGSKGRLRKYWLKGEKAGTSEVIAILPGYPDNVRANERNEFWVAIHCRRTIYSYLNGIYPRLRQFLLKLPISAKLQYLIHIGGRFTAVVVKYSPEGKLLQILEDRQGKVVRAVSEVEERDGKLWMGSVLMSFISVYQLE